MERKHYDHGWGSVVYEATRHYKRNSEGGIVAPMPGAYKPQFPEEDAAGDGRYSPGQRSGRYYSVYRGPWVEWALNQRERAKEATR